MEKTEYFANLLDIGRRFINNIDFHELVNKENLFAPIKLNKLMHNNNRYFDSIHDRKF
jgi:hypothetical protein